MRPVLQHIYEAALEPHLTGDQFRLAVVKAVQRRNVEAHETFDEAFKRYIQEAIFEYEREHLAK